MSAFGKLSFLSAALSICSLPAAEACLVDVKRLELDPNDYGYIENYLNGSTSGPAIRRAMVAAACTGYIRLQDPYEGNDIMGFARTDEQGHCIY
jgi:hypothetical protein